MMKTDVNKVDCHLCQSFKQLKLFGGATMMKTDVNKVDCHLCQSFKQVDQ